MHDKKRELPRLLVSDNLKCEIHLLGVDEPRSLLSYQNFNKIRTTKNSDSDMQETVLKSI
jgi:hypothetical protein